MEGNGTHQLQPNFKTDCQIDGNEPTISEDGTMLTCGDKGRVYTYHKFNHELDGPQSITMNIVSPNKYAIDLVLWSQKSERLGEKPRNDDGYNGCVYFCPRAAKISFNDDKFHDKGEKEDLELNKSDENIDNIRAVVDMSKGTLAFYQGETIIFEEYQDDSFKTGFPVLELKFMKEDASSTFI